MVAPLVVLPSAVIGKKVTLYDYVPEGATWEGPPLFSASTTIAAVGTDTVADETTYVEEVVVTYAAQPYPTQYSDFRDATTTWTLISEPTTATYTFVEGATRIYQSVPADTARGLFEAGSVRSCAVREDGTADCVLTVLWDMGGTSADVVAKPTTYSGSVTPIYTLTMDANNGAALRDMRGPIWALCIGFLAATMALL